MGNGYLRAGYDENEAEIDLVSDLAVWAAIGLVLAAEQPEFGGE